ncbi:hypothetical protein [Serratia fonticola]|uniref:hypothetical protein n=1 Tax=Serratia fonticola TaxID=47917 RepID=UPI001377EFA8|nr:hypothetical protein [Serratia fonticola]MBC3217063.1 hypothetical protein [Serratia fonticola]NCG54677.1 hypothetical protein [Serratia fonticola]
MQLLDGGWLSQFNRTVIILNDKTSPNIQGSATTPTLSVKKAVTLPISPLRTLFKRFRQWFGVAINLNDQIMNKQNNLINTQKLELITKNYKF